eukprot:m.103606 g.103606  ORF g.103606 m.103606 type:complete len:56 (+) comp15226_c0_seq6:1866-2033(+)
MLKCMLADGRACHGAIKFGDPLSKEDQTNLLEQLSACKVLAMTPSSRNNGTLSFV